MNSFGLAFFEPLDSDDNDSYTFADWFDVTPTTAACAFGVSGTLIAPTLLLPSCWTKHQVEPSIVVQMVFCQQWNYCFLPQCVWTSMYDAHTITKNNPLTTSPRRTTMVVDTKPPTSWRRNHVFYKYQIRSSNDRRNTKVDGANLIRDEMGQKRAPFTLLQHESWIKIYSQQVSPALPWYSCNDILL